jgi:hypothetical protein
MENVMFNYVFKYFWALMIVWMFVLAGIWRHRGRAHVVAQPELAEGYRKLTRGFLIWGNIPWVAMGMGCVFGGLGMLDYFSLLGNGEWLSNAWVILFLAVTIALWALMVWWVFLADGAQVLACHPGWSNNIAITQPWQVKVFVALMVTSGVVGLTILISGVIPMPSFR